MPKKNSKETILKILEKYGIPSSRTGGFEYIVATNLMIYEELKKISKKELSLLDVWYDAYDQKVWEDYYIYKAYRRGSIYCWNLS